MLYLLLRLCFIHCLWLSLLTRMYLNHLRVQHAYWLRNTLPTNSRPNILTGDTKKYLSLSDSSTSATIIKLLLLCFQRSFVIHLCCQLIYSVMETNHSTQNTIKLRKRSKNLNLLLYCLFLFWLHWMNLIQRLPAWASLISFGWFRERVPPGNTSYVWPSSSLDTWGDLIGEFQWVPVFFLIRVWLATRKWLSQILSGGRLDKYHIELSIILAEKKIAIISLVYPSFENLLPWL